MDKKYKSFAQWPAGTLGGYDNDVSSDEHYTEDEADNICLRLLYEGFGGDRQIFPIKTWVEPIIK